MAGQDFTASHLVASSRIGVETVPDYEHVKRRCDAYQAQSNLGYNKTHPSVEGKFQVNEINVILQCIPNEVSVDLFRWSKI